MAIQSGRLDPKTWPAGEVDSEHGCEDKKWMCVFLDHKADSVAKDFSVGASVLGEDAWWPYGSEMDCERRKSRSEAPAMALLVSYMNLLS